MNGKVYIILIAIVALLSLSIAGLAVYVFTINAVPDNNARSAARQEEIRINYNKVTRTVPFESEKIINLKMTDDRAHIVKVKLEILSQKDKKLDKQIENRITEIQEMIISAFNSRTINEIQSENSKENIKNEILKELNAMFSTDKFLKVVINDWFFQ